MGSRKRTASTIDIARCRADGIRMNINTIRNLWDELKKPVSLSSASNMTTLELAYEQIAVTFEICCSIRMGGESTTGLPKLGKDLLGSRVSAINANCKTIIGRWRDLADMNPTEPPVAYWIEDAYEAICTLYLNCHEQYTERLES